MVCGSQSATEGLVAIVLVATDYTDGNPDFILCYPWLLLTRETGALSRLPGSWRLIHSG